MENGTAEGADWAGSLAAALVARVQLSASAAQGLQKAFRDVEEVSVLLANGDIDALECFELIHQGNPRRDALTPSSTLPAAEPSAASCALKEQRVVVVDTSTPGRDALLDWRQLHAGGRGVSWLLAAPLCCPCAERSSSCRGGESSRLLGAVLVGGRGDGPTVDQEWLQDWACEMSTIIRHASIQVMECSLEMLGVLFPPRVLEQLVANAAKKTGQVDLAELLRQQGAASRASSWRPGSRIGASASGAGSAANTGGPGSSLRSSVEEDRPVGWSAVSAGQAGGALHLQGLAGEQARWQQQQQHEEQGLQRHDALSSMVVGGGSGTVHTSPFAALAATAEAGPASFSLGPASPPAGPDTGLPQQGLVARCQSVPPDFRAPALLREASAGGSRMASAMLRQLSLQSDLSFLLEDPATIPNSPHNWEVEGFEDILQEDRRSVTERRASMALERAQSRPTGTAALDQCIAEAAASLEQAAAQGGLPAAVHSAHMHQTAEQVGQQAAAAFGSAEMVWPAPEGGSPAAEQQQERGAVSMADGKSLQLAPLPAARSCPPPTVHVPWLKKPILNPLGSGSSSRDSPEFDPLVSPRRLPAAGGGSTAGSSTAAGSSSFGTAASRSPYTSSTSSAKLPPAAVLEGLLSPRKPDPAAGTATGAAAAGSGSYRSSSFAGSGTIRGSACPSSVLSDGSAPALSGSQPLHREQASGSGAISGAGTTSSPAPAATTQQQLDLTFASPALEASYRRWLSSHLLRGDASLGLVHWLVAVTAFVKLLLAGASLVNLLAVAGTVLMALPALPSLIFPAWWLTRRTPCLVAARLLVTLLFGAHLMALAGQSSSLLGTSWTEAALANTGAAALLFMPLRFSLPFALHMPLHLLCLWILTAGASLAHIGGSRGAASAAAYCPRLPLPAALVMQLFVGFLLSSLLVYCREAGLRRSFLQSRRAAACLSGHSKRPPRAAPPVSSG